jgi:hypothetical protein
MTLHCERPSSVPTNSITSQARPRCWPSLRNGGRTAVLPRATCSPPLSTAPTCGRPPPAQLDGGTPYPERRAAIDCDLFQPSPLRGARLGDPQKPFGPTRDTCVSALSTVIDHLNPSIARSATQLATKPASRPPSSLWLGLSLRGVGVALAVHTTTVGSATSRRVMMHINKDLAEPASSRSGGMACDLEWPAEL